MNQNQINADIALKHRLYISGWQLSETLKDIRKGESGTVLLHYADGNPVGVVCKLKYDRINLMVFVKKSHRRQGIGTMLINQLNLTKEDRGGQIRVEEGVRGSMNFYSKQNINDITPYYKD